MVLLLIEGDTDVAAYAREQVVHLGAIPFLVDLMRDGTNFGIALALSVILILVEDANYTRDVYEQVTSALQLLALISLIQGGHGAIALCLGTPIAKIVVKEELRTRGLPHSFIEE